MSSNFAFRGPLRPIARAIVDAMVPRWPDFPHDLTEPVLEQVEEMIRNYPAAVQAGMSMVLGALELCGPLLGDGFTRTSRLDRARVTRRLEKLADHPLAQVRNLTTFFGILVSFAAYSRPEVEEHLGVHRRAWRDNRKAFRRTLVAIDEARGADPVVPAALAQVDPETYLRFDREGARP